MMKDLILVAIFFFFIIIILFQSSWITKLYENKQTKMEKGDPKHNFLGST